MTFHPHLKKILVKNKNAKIFLETQQIKQAFGHTISYLLCILPSLLFPLFFVIKTYCKRYKAAARTSGTTPTTNKRHRPVHEQTEALKRYRYRDKEKEEKMGAKGHNSQRHQNCELCAKHLCSLARLREAVHRRVGVDAKRAQRGVVRRQGTSVHHEQRQLLVVLWRRGNGGDKVEDLALQLVQEDVQ